MEIIFRAQNPAVFYSWEPLFTQKNVKDSTPVLLDSLAWFWKWFQVKTAASEQAQNVTMWSIEMDLVPV